MHYSAIKKRKEKMLVLSLDIVFIIVLIDLVLGFYYRSNRPCFRVLLNEKNKFLRHCSSIYRNVYIYIVISWPVLNDDLVFLRFLVFLERSALGDCFETVFLAILGSTPVMRRCLC